MLQGISAQMFRLPDGLAIVPVDFYWLYVLHVLGYSIFAMLIERVQPRRSRQREESPAMGELAFLVILWPILGGSDIRGL
jgi:hypothetical protein